MRAGDVVVYPANVILWGVGTIERTLPNGKIVVRFGNSEELFSPHELELADVWAADQGLLNTPAKRAA